MITDSIGKVVTFGVFTGTVRGVSAPELSDAGQPADRGILPAFGEANAVANKGLSMRKVREVLRLHHVAGLSGRAIARSLKLSPTTVKRYIDRAEEAGLSWPLPESLDDARLERRLLPGAVSMPGEPRFPMPNWSRVHRELRRKGVTRVDEQGIAHGKGDG